MSAASASSAALASTWAAPPSSHARSVFAPGSASAYVCSDRARDVLQVALELQPPNPTDPANNDLRAVVAELGAGPSDMAVYDDAAGRRVVLAGDTRHPRGRRDRRRHRQFRSIPIPDPITDRSGTAYDHGWGRDGSAAAALDLVRLTPRRFGLGLRLEAGYVAAQGIALTLHTDRPGDAIPLTMTAFPFGHLDLSGPSAGLSLLGQF